MATELNQLNKIITDAEQDIRNLLKKLKEGANLETFKVKPQTDKLLKFSEGYHARLTAGKAIGSTEELKEQLKEQFVSYLHSITALKDEVAATSPKTLAEVNLKRADDRYNQRAGILKFIVDRANNLLSNSVTKVEASRQILAGEKVPESEANWFPLKSITNKSSDDLVRVVSRTIPNDPQLEDDLNSLLVALINGAHTEKSVKDVIPKGKSIAGNYEAQLELANDQEFRDAIAASFAPLLKKLIMEAEVEAYDDVFRNAYFAVVDYLIKYYNYRATSGDESSELEIEKSTEDVSGETLNKSEKSTEIELERADDEDEPATTSEAVSSVTKTKIKVNSKESTKPEQSETLGQISKADQTPAEKVDLRKESSKKPPINPLNIP